jgi:lipoprotein-releasing system permease protein
LRERIPLRGPLFVHLAWRYLVSGRSRLLSGTARAALLAITLGVTALVVAMALMTGYQEELERKLTADGAAILAIPIGLQDHLDPAEVRRRVEALPGVARVNPVTFGQAALSLGGGAATAEVTVRGIEPGVGLLSAPAELLAIGEDGVPGAVLGEELAKSLAVVPGDLMRLVAVGFENGRPRFRYQSLRCTGTFRVGLSDFDSSWMLVERGLAGHLFGSEAGGTLFEIAPVDLAQAPAVAEAVDAVLDEDFLVSNWLEVNRPLFNALRLQKRFLFLVLGLIVFVSTFNVASTLIVAVRERMREIGVLAALGLARRDRWKSFVLYGSLLGAVGVGLGVSLGCSAVWILDRFELIRFDAEVAAIYFVNAVRFRVQTSDLLTIVVFSLVVNFLACALPAWRATQVDPSRALRYE